ncbi:MAG: response regulator [Chloroflexi bacterium]|nr:response regulator [Chloroflexota bacterium]
MMSAIFWNPLDLILSTEGHQTQALESAQAALEMLLNGDDNRSDLVITDVLMPGMSGLELSDMMHRSPAYTDLPVLFISASVTPDVETEIAQMEGVTFLRKPFQVDELCSLVNRLSQAN